MSMLVEMGGDATTESHRSKVGGAARGRRARSSGTPMCQSGLFSKSRAVSGRANGGSHLLQRCPKIRVFIRAYLFLSYTSLWNPCHTHVRRTCHSSSSASAPCGMTYGRSP